LRFRKAEGGEKKAGEVSQFHAGGLVANGIWQRGWGGGKSSQGSAREAITIFRGGLVADFKIKRTAGGVGEDERAAILHPGRSYWLEKKHGEEGKKGRT